MKKNVFFSILTNISRLLTNLIIFFFLARILTVEDFGIFSYAQTFSIIVVLFVDFGYSLKLPKDTAESRENISHIHGESMYIRTVLAIIVIVFCILQIIFDKTGNLYSCLILIFTISTIFQSFATNIFVTYRSINNFKIESELVTLYNILISAIGILVAIITKNIYYIALVYLVFRGLLFLHLLIIFNRDFGLKWIPTKFFITIKSLSPYAIHYILSGIYMSINVLIIKFYIDEYDLGIYQAGMKIITGATFLLFVIQQVFIPNFSVMKNQVNFKSYVSKINTICIMIGALAFFLIYLFRKELIMILFGEKYLILQNYVIWFGMLVFLRFFGAIYGILLTISDRQKVRTKYLIVSVIILMLLNVILMPKFKIVGSLIALIISHTILYSLSIFTIKKELKSFFITNFFILPIKSN